MQIQINTLERQLPDESVVVVHWSVIKTATNAQGQTFTASSYGTESFTADPDSPEFIPYAELTPEVVQGWLVDRWGTEGLEAKETALDSMLEAQMQPKVLTGLPWADQQI